MSRFNQTASKQAPTPDTKNLAGGEAFSQTHNVELVSNTFIGFNEI